MPTQTLTLPVLFRADREDGQLWITAVFPTELGTYDPSTFTIYQHVGQHGSGTRAWYSRTRAAKPAEYRELLKELREIYGRSMGDGDPIIRLRVIQRFGRHYDRVRQEKARALTQRGEDSNHV